MDREIAAYESQRLLTPQGYLTPLQGGRDSAEAHRSALRSLIRAGVLSGLVLLLGLGLHLFAELVAFFDAPSYWGGADVVRHFWGSGFEVEYVVLLAILGGLLVPIARLAKGGGGRPGVFLIVGILGLLCQTVALHVTMLQYGSSRIGGFPGLVLDGWALAIPLVEVVAIPLGLVYGEWSRSRLARSPHAAIS